MPQSDPPADAAGQLREPDDRLPSRGREGEGGGAAPSALPLDIIGTVTAPPPDITVTALPGRQSAVDEKPASQAAPFQKQIRPDILRIDGRPLATADDVARYFGVASHRLTRTLYKIPDAARYTQFEIPKRTGGMRQIDAPVGLLREVQDKLLPDLNALYRPHPAAHGFIPTRSVVTNAAGHAGRRWVLNIDLKDFFPSINFGRIRGLFMRPPFDMAPAAASVCAQIVTFRNGLPQGAPTSPVLSNFIAATLDRNLLRLARSHRLHYSRYADDITLSTDAQIFPPAVVEQQLGGAGERSVLPGPALAAAVSSAGFEIHPRKVRLQGRGERQTVTGLTVNARVNVARTRIRQLRAMLHAWRVYGLEKAAGAHFARYKSPGSGRDHRPVAFRNIVYGHLAFIKMARGSDDPVFLKLCAQVLERDPNPSRFIRQLMFGADDFDVFISHASEDKDAIARPIMAACQRAGIRAFLDEAHIGFGQNFTGRINVALGAARTVLVIVSSHSVSKEWPLAEINTALTMEVDRQKRVVPVMVGRPDLSRLPLLRTKRWVVWRGEAEAVIDALRQAGDGVDENKEERGRADLTRRSGGHVPDVSESTPVPPRDQGQKAEPTTSTRSLARRLFSWLSGRQ